MSKFFDKDWNSIKGHLFDFNWFKQRKTIKGFKKYNTDTHFPVKIHNNDEKNIG